MSLLVKTNSLPLGVLLGEDVDVFKLIVLLFSIVYFTVSSRKEEMRQWESAGKN